MYLNLRVLIIFILFSLALSSTKNVTTLKDFQSHEATLTRIKDPSISGRNFEFSSLAPSTIFPSQVQLRPPTSQILSFKTLKSLAVTKALGKLGITSFLNRLLSIRLTLQKPLSTLIRFFGIALKAAFPKADVDKWVHMETSKISPSSKYYSNSPLLTDGTNLNAPELLKTLDSKKNDMWHYEFLIKGQKHYLYFSQDIRQSISKKSIEAALLQAAKVSRAEGREVPENIYIVSLSQSPFLFEDKKSNGIIGINQAVLDIENTHLREQLLKVGLSHELTHELTGHQDEIFENEQGLRDIEYALDLGINITDLLEALGDTTQYDDFALALLIKMLNQEGSTKQINSNLFQSPNEMISVLLNSLAKGQVLNSQELSKTLPFVVKQIQRLQNAHEHSFAIEALGSTIIKALQNTNSSQSSSQLLKFLYELEKISPKGYSISKKLKKLLEENKIPVLPFGKLENIQDHFKTPFNRVSLQREIFQEFPNIQEAKSFSKWLSTVFQAQSSEEEISSAFILYLLKNPQGFKRLIKYNSKEIAKELIEIQQKYKNQPTLAALLTREMRNFLFSLFKDNRHVKNDRHAQEFGEKLADHILDHLPITYGLEFEVVFPTEEGKIINFEEPQEETDEIGVFKELKKLAKENPKIAQFFLENFDRPGKSFRVISELRGLEFASEVHAENPHQPVVESLKNLRELFLQHLKKITQKDSPLLPLLNKHGWVQKTDGHIGVIGMSYHVNLMDHASDLTLKSGKFFQGKPSDDTKTKQPLRWAATALLTPFFEETSFSKEKAKKVQFRNALLDRRYRAKSLLRLESISNFHPNIESTDTITTFSPSISDIEFLKEIQKVGLDHLGQEQMRTTIQEINALKRKISDNETLSLSCADAYYFGMKLALARWLQKLVIPSDRQSRENLFEKYPFLEFIHSTCMAYHYASSEKEKEKLAEGLIEDLEAWFLDNFSENSSFFSDFLSALLNDPTFIKDALRIMTPTQILYYKNYVNRLQEALSNKRTPPTTGIEIFKPRYARLKEMRAKYPDVEERGVNFLSDYKSRLINKEDGPVKEVKDNEGVYYRRGYRVKSFNPNTPSDHLFWMTMTSFDEKGDIEQGSMAGAAYGISHNIRFTKSHMNKKGKQGNLWSLSIELHLSSVIEKAKELMSKGGNIIMDGHVQAFDGKNSHHVQALYDGSLEIHDERSNKHLYEISL